MIQLGSKIKPTKGFSNLIHLGYNILLPILLFILVRVSFVPLAIAVLLFAKWRMFAVKPRYWLAHVRTNAVDIIVGLSFVSFMVHSPSQAWVVVWTIAYIVWLTVIKPRTSPIWVGLQAGLGLILGFMAVYTTWGRAPLLELVIVAWLICYVCARHYLSSFDEPLSGVLSIIWAYFGASLTWIMGHWLLYYGVVALPTIFLSTLGIGLAILYYLEKNDSLSLAAKREIVLIMSTIIIVLLVFSDWGDKAI